MQPIIQKIILRKKQILQNPLSFGKDKDENAEKPSQDKSDSAEEKEKTISKKEIFRPIVEIPDAKNLPTAKVSRKIAMVYFGSKHSLF